MPSSRTEVAAVALGDKIYVMGGYEKNGDLVEEYDTQHNSWRRRAALPRHLHHLGAAVVAGKIYVIGGYIFGHGPGDTVYEYDPSPPRWGNRGPMVPARGGLATATGGGKNYCIGGGGAG